MAFIKTGVLISLTAAAQSALCAGETYLVKASAARLRSMPSLTDKPSVLGLVTHGMPVTVMERKAFPGIGTWLRVKAGRREGWINSRLLTKSDAPPKVEETQVTAQPVSSKRLTASVDATAKAKTAPPAKEKGKVKLADTEKPQTKKKTPAKPAGINKCLSRLDNLTAADADIVRPLVRAGVIQTAWHSPTGTGFSLSGRGALKITLNALPDKAVATVARSADQSVETINFALGAGLISFNATICLKNGNYSINLVGTGSTAGKTGRLALRPSTAGFSASGQIAGASIRETFNSGAQAGR